MGELPGCERAFFLSSFMLSSMLNVTQAAGQKSVAACCYRSASYKT